MSVSIAEPVVELIDQEAMDQAGEADLILVEVQALVVTNAEEYQLAAGYFTRARKAEKALEDKRLSLTRPLDNSKKGIMDFFRKPIDVLARVQAVSRGLMQTFDKAQETARKAEEDRIRAEQQKEEERLARLAKAAQKRGDEEKATAFQERAAAVASAPPAIVPRAPVAATGIQKRRVWKFRVTVLDEVPLAYLMVNETLLGKFAVATKGAVPVAGVEFYEEELIGMGR